MSNDSDVLERNEELNKQILGIAGTFTRRKVVDSLLAVLIVLGIATVVVLLIGILDIEQHVENSSVQETQLICEHLLTENQEHHYVACDEVGRPDVRGGR